MTTKKLRSLEIGQSETFPLSKLLYLQVLSTRFAKKGLFIRVTKGEKEVTAKRVNTLKRPNTKEELQAMDVGGKLIDHSDNYRSLHVTVTRLNRSGIKEWNIEKEKDLVTVEMVK